VLTGLPNRSLFLDRLQRAIAGWNRSNEGFALFFIDLDHFKEINDRYGHYAGDLVLRATAQRIEGCTRQTDTVARIAGDEFVVLLSDSAEARHAHAVAQEILAAVAHPVQIDAECAVRVTASVGISLCPDDGIDADVLLNCADRAMYTVKAGGRGAVGFHQTAAVECNCAAVSRAEQDDPAPAGLIH
jgi:diguanylate cyclase (GGDEF)-like protein